MNSQVKISLARVWRLVCTWFALTDLGRLSIHCE